ncbi:MAG: hypothetical protein ABR910_00940 [Acidobacteriaceae bacterium]|jgi:biopolymer transport protein ExbD
MKLSYSTTAMLIVTALAVLRLHHGVLRAPLYGMRVALVHDCTNEEALRELGDDRQIIVESNAEGSISINGTPFTHSTVGPELDKIFESRTPKLVWYIADPHLTYGQAMQNLSGLHADRANIVIAVPTTNQIAVSSAQMSQCPYGF